MLTSTSSHPGWRAPVACLAVLAAFVACGGAGSEPTQPTTPNASDLPIVYAYSTAGRAAPRNLYLTSVDGKATLPLPDLGGDEAYPAWKPGARDLLVRETAGGNTKLLLVNEDGSNVRTVPDVNSIARWSPDGAWIVFANTGAELLEVMHPDGSARRWISSVAGGPRLAHPSWSPDGRVLFEFGDDGGPNAIFVQRVDLPYGGNFTTGPYDEWPAWSPNGSTIAFSLGSRTPAGAMVYEIGLLNADGSGKRQLTADVNAVNLAPTWSPDGQWVLYEHWDQAMSKCSFERISVNGGAPVTVVPATPNGACGGASWR